MEDKIKINDKTAWFAKELTLATMHEQFMEKFAIECEDNKGKEWYGWKESDSPQKVWDWVEPRLQAIPIEPPVSDDFGGKEYLLCAAIYYQDGKRYKHQPKNIESGIVVCGRRHHNCYITLSSLLGDKYDIKLTHNQGFVTSKDRYLERKEAAQVAFECGQVKELNNTIFSEMLW